MEIKLGRKLETHEVVMHECDNPPCWNPNHLKVGTLLENLQDSINKGRHNTHVRKKRRKNLSPEQVLVIKMRLRMGHGCWSISRTYSVSESSIRDIKNGRTYVHLKLGPKDLSVEKGSPKCNDTGDNDSVGLRSSTGETT
jgi:hypothetical protein